MSDADRAARVAQDDAAVIDADARTLMVRVFDWSGESMMWKGTLAEWLAKNALGAEWRVREVSDYGDLALDIKKSWGWSEETTIQVGRA